MTRIVIADDQALFREGLRLLLSTRPNMDVVGEAADGEEAVALVERLQPAVVLMDLRMPRVDGIQATALCPGYVATSMQERELIWESQARGMSIDEVSAEHIAKTPLGRMQTAEDVARVVAYLASDESEFLTGAAIDITGGAHLT